jgi:hypothetical protein
MSGNGNQLGDLTAYCPECKTELKYCLGDLFVCPGCSKNWWTHQVIDKDGYYLLEECPEHGLNHGGYTINWEERKKNCIQCGKELVRVKLLKYRYNGPYEGIAREMTHEYSGDKACKVQFRCEHYGTEECKRCPNSWESKYKRMSDSKIRKMVESSRKRITKMKGATR